MTAQKHTPWEVEGRLPTREEAAFAARILSSCNGYDLDVWSEGNWPTDALEWLGPLASFEGKTLPELLAVVEAVWPGSFWHMAKGRVRQDEPLYGFQVLFGTDEVIAEGEGDSPELAVLSAIARAESHPNG